jgi:hypothetical protein
MANLVVKINFGSGESVIERLDETSKMIEIVKFRTCRAM